MGNIRMNKDLGGGSFYDMACYNISAISYLPVSYTHLDVYKRQA